MTSEQKQVRDWMSAFGQETPSKPTIPSIEIRALRAKLILEEALETIEALGFWVTRDKEISPRYTLNSELFKPNLIDIADGCEDLKVVTEGTLIACGLCQDIITKVGNEDHFNDDPLFDEVMRSNNSKMWTKDEIDYEMTQDNMLSFRRFHDKFIVMNADGKVIKSSSYSPANLQPIIDELTKE